MNGCERCSLLEDELVALRQLEEECRHLITTPLELDKASLKASLIEALEDLDVSREFAGRPKIP